MHIPSILLILFLIYLFVLLVNSEYYFEKNFPYEFAKKINQFLNKLPRISPDPTKELIQNLPEYLLKAVGFQFLFRGQKEDIHLEKVPVPVRSKRWTNYEEIKHYYLHANAINCETSLEEYTCYYCRKIGGELIDVSAGFKYGTKSFIVLNRKRKEIVLTYRATLSLTSTIADLLFLQGPILIGNVSKEITANLGTQRSTLIHFRKNVPIIKHLLKKHPNYKIVLTGLSLGAQMSHFEFFLYNYLNVFPGTKIELLTFSTPRTGNKAYADYINSLPTRIGRVHRGHDIVHNLYPAIFGYYYAHNEIYIDVDKITNQTIIKHCRNDIYEDPTCVVKYIFPLIWPNFKGGLDHGLPLPGIDVLQCIIDHPFEAIINYPFPYRYFIPPKILQSIPKLNITNGINPGVLALQYFFTRGLTNMYNAAIDPETYKDPNYKAKFYKHLIFTKEYGPEIL